MAELGRVELLDARQVQRLVESLVQPYTGKLLPLATTGPERWKAFPDQPTLSEAGLPISSTVWFALIAAPGTPPEVVTTSTA